MIMEDCRSKMKKKYNYDLNWIPDNVPHQMDSKNSKHFEDIPSYNSISKIQDEKTAY